MKKKGLFIKTYGCQMNVYDSVKMQELLKPHGFEVVSDINKANMVILNTCHIREKAAEKVYSELGRIRPLKDLKISQEEDFVIVVAGCVAQAEGEEVFSRAPFVDIVVGPQSYQNLPILLEQVKREQGWALALDFDEESKFDKLPEENIASQGPAAFVTVQEGCDKFCNFCVVPYTRGRQYSRPVADIYREALKLVSLGAREITLLGQNVSAYYGINPIEQGGKDLNLAKLIERLASIDGLKRIRYVTSHPKDMDDDIIQAHRDIEKLMPFLHLPVQAGSNAVLKAMNRGHTRDDYFRVIDKFREARPDMAFSSDFIVGYPGETDKDFEDTMDLVRRVNYALCYSFKYSIRPGTPGAGLLNQVAEDVKTERLARLQELLNQQQHDFNASKNGQEMEVLLEKPGKHPGQIVGKSPYLQTVNISNCPAELLGSVRRVRITHFTKNTLSGELI